MENGDVCGAERLGDDFTTDVPSRDLDRLYERMESDLKLKGKTKEEIQKTLSDEDYVETWIRGKRRTASRGQKQLAKRITISFKVEGYQRKGKIIKGYRASRERWSPDAINQLNTLSQEGKGLHEISKEMGRSYDSIRRKRQNLTKNQSFAPK